MHDRRALCILPAAVLMFFLVILPLAEIVRIVAVDHEKTGPLIRHLLTSPLYQRVIANTLEISFVVAVGSVLIGWPIAYLILHAADGRRKALLGISIASLWLSVLIRSYAWTILLATGGPLSQVMFHAGLTAAPASFLFTKNTVIMAMIHVLTPYVILSIWGVNSRVVRSQLSVAESFGASRALYLFKIFLPQSLRSAIGGAALVFLLSLGFLITPELLGGGKASTMMIAVLIDEQVMQFGNWVQGSLLALLLLAVVIVLIVAFWRLWSVLQPPFFRER